MDKAYADTVRLLLAVVSDVFANDIFAMEGRTAINLLVRDMPCLSVDIDVPYLPWQTPRDEALQAHTRCFRLAGIAPCRIHRDTRAAATLYLKASDKGQRAGKGQRKGAKGKGSILKRPKKGALEPPAIRGSPCSRCSSANGCHPPPAHRPHPPSKLQKG